MEHLGIQRMEAATWRPRTRAENPRLDRACWWFAGLAASFAAAFFVSILLLIIVSSADLGPWSNPPTAAQDRADVARYDFPGNWGQT